MGDSTSTGSNHTNGDSGRGTRPTTAGGVDNIGAADSFTPGKVSQPGHNSPAPPEKMREKRQDDSADTAGSPGQNKRY